MSWRIWPPANEYQSAANSPPASQPVHTGQPDRRARSKPRSPATPSAPRPSSPSPIIGVTNSTVPHPSGVETWGAADAVDTGSRPSRRNPTPQMVDSCLFQQFTPRPLDRLAWLARASRHFSPPVPQHQHHPARAYTGRDSRWPRRHPRVPPIVETSPWRNPSRPEQTGRDTGKPRYPPLAPRWTIERGLNAPRYPSPFSPSRPSASRATRSRSTPSSMRMMITPAAARLIGRTVDSPQRIT